MPGSKTDYAEKKVLDAWLGNAAFPSNATVYIGLFTTMPADDGTGGVEVSGGSYARVSVTNNSTNWPNATGGNPSTKSNGTAITFAQATANWGTVVGFGVFDASTSGNLIYFGPLESGTEYPATADASTDTLRAPGSAFSNTNQVKVETVEGFALPTGLTADTVYFIINASSDTFKLSTTSGGSAIDITADGVCLVMLDASKPVNNLDTASFAIGALVVTEA